MNPYILLGIQAIAIGALTVWAIQLYRWQKTLQIWHQALTRLQKLLSAQQAMQIFNAGPPTDPMYLGRDHHNTTLH